VADFVFITLFQEPEVLKLGIEIDMQGILQGTVLIKSTPQNAGFFLPGRFSIKEAFLDKFLSSSLIDYTLPVIYNPYGEIIPIKPVAKCAPVL
jgi:hypothetical protein